MAEKTMTSEQIRELMSSLQPLSANETMTCTDRDHGCYNARWTVQKCDGGWFLVMCEYPDGNYIDNANDKTFPTELALVEQTGHIRVWSAPRHNGLFCEAYQWELSRLREKYPTQSWDEIVKALVPDDQVDSDAALQLIADFARFNRRYQEQQATAQGVASETQTEEKPAHGWWATVRTTWHHLWN